MEQAAELTNKYEEGLVPSQEEKVKLNEFFNTLEELEKKFDNGEINREKHLALIDEARKRINISTERVIGEIGLADRAPDYPPHINVGVNLTSSDLHLTSDVPEEEQGIITAGDPMDNAEK